MASRCDPPVEWWQGSVFYEIFPASFQASSGNGVGDLKGIMKRLDYVQDLGVKVVRLNSIFRCSHYPEHYGNITSLEDIQEQLGTLGDFKALVDEVHRRNMFLVLDLPLHPYVTNFTLGNSHIPKTVKNENVVREKRDTENTLLPTVLPSPEPTSFQNIRSVLSSVPLTGDPVANAYTGSDPPQIDIDHQVTSAIKYWLGKNVDGFYLKGLENYVNETSFVDLIRHWKSLVGMNRILICSVDALDQSPQDKTRNTILNKIDLLDVTLNFSDGTTGLKSQVDTILNGDLFKKPGYPWVHWSVGRVDTERIASTLKVNNASITASLMGMMLPGTPSIFYGDEVRLVLIFIIV